MGQDSTLANGGMRTLLGSGVIWRSAQSVKWRAPLGHLCLSHTHRQPFGLVNMVAPKQFLDYVDANSTKFVDRLSEAVAIPRQVT